MKTNQDRIIGIAVLLIGGFLFWETFNFKVVEWEPLGLAFWPRILLVCLGIVAAFYVIRGSVDKGPFLSVKPKGYVGLLCGLIYVLLLETVGFLILTPLFIFAFTLVLGKSSRRTLVEAACMAVLGTVIIYLVFNKGLLVQLPEGILE